MVPFSLQRLSVLALTSLLSFAPMVPAQAGTTTPVLSPPLSVPEKSANSPKHLPATVTDAVLKDIMKSSGMKREALKVVKAETRTWSDGCLGLADPGIMCIQTVVPGWQVTVKAKRLRWVYRTNNNGTVIKLDKSASRLQDQALKPTRLDDRDLPPKLTADTLFRVMTSGGFTGQTLQTQLLSDGSIVQSRVNPDGTTSAPQVSRVKPEQLRHFQQVMAAAQIEQFDRLSYPSTPGAADFLTVTLTTRTGTVQYAETVKAQLPDRLKAVIQAWDAMVRN